MALSKSNIGRDEFRRLRSDETGEMWIDIHKDGQPANDLANRTFAVEFVRRALTGKPTTALLLQNVELLKQPAVPCRIGVWLSKEQRDRLPDENYFMYLHETTSGKRNPLRVYDFKWLNEPETEIVGEPIEPAVLVLDLRSDEETASGSSVLQGPAGAPAGGGVADLSALINLPVAQAQFVYVASEGRAFIKAGPNLYFEILITPTTVTL